MKHTESIERLSAFLDGELDDDARSAVEAHLADCAACREAEADLRRIVTAAREMPPAPPREDLWPAIAARLGDAAETLGTATPRTAKTGTAASIAGAGLGNPDPAWWRRRLVLSWPQALGAAAAVVAVAVAGAFWVARGPLPAADPELGLAAHSESLAASSDATFLALAGEVRMLRERLVVEDDRLDPETVRVLNKNLRLIEDAIAQSRAALASDPGSAEETGRFVASLSGKLELLRQATDVALARANGG